MRDGRPGAYRVPFRAMAEEPRGALAASEAGLTFDLVRTERPSSAEESARLQRIVVRRGAADYVFVLVPGGRQIDWPKLRAHLGTRRLSLPDRDEARDATGYERGTITPFGATTAWPVVADASVRAAERVAIGAGAHGVNLYVTSGDLLQVLHADEADVTSAADG
jgi:Cys-tRNA(Pro)/Cys-tRNA(Cys) deacylase